MRKRVSEGGVTVQAIAGNHAVFFGLDLSDAARSDCLGWSIHREDHTTLTFGTSTGVKFDA